MIYKYENTLLTDKKFSVIISIVEYFNIFGVIRQRGLHR